VAEATGETSAADVTDSVDICRMAGELRVALGRVVRRIKQAHAHGELTLSESSVLSRLDREGPAGPGALAEVEQVRPQAMGATLAGLEVRGLVARAPDPADGRRVVMSVTAEGQRAVLDRRSLTTQRMAAVLAEDFTADERRRLADSIGLFQRLAERL
jgi:DNA-binding MarR family transcriptional regulator